MRYIYESFFIFETYDYLNFPHVVAVLAQSYDEAVEKLNNGEFEYPFKSWRFIGDTCHESFKFGGQRIPKADIYI